MRAATSPTPGTDVSSNHQGRHGQALLLRQPQPAPAAPAAVRGCLQLRPPAQDPAQPHDLRVRLPDLDESARTLQPRSVTPHAGTEHRVRAVAPSFSPAVSPYAPACIFGTKPLTAASKLDCANNCSSGRSARNHGDLRHLRAPVRGCWGGSEGHARHRGEADRGPGVIGSQTWTIKSIRGATRPKKYNLFNRHAETLTFSVIHLFPRTSGGVPEFVTRPISATPIIIVPRTRGPEVHPKAASTCRSGQPAGFRLTRQSGRHVRVPPPASRWVHGRANVPRRYCSDPLPSRRRRGARADRSP